MDSVLTSGMRKYKSSAGSSV